jgi:hypothetical protein
MNLMSNNQSTLWHNRYGHINFETLIAMSVKGSVEGLPKIEKVDQICEGCALGKQSRTIIPTKSSWKSSHHLQLVHSDICGPMRTQSIGGCRYFITFIDDFTRKTWVYFLKAKSEAL